MILNIAKKLKIFLPVIIGLIILLLAFLTELSIYNVSYYPDCFLFNYARDFFGSSNTFLDKALPYFIGIIAIIIYLFVCLKNDFSKNIKEAIFKTDSEQLPSKLNKIGFSLTFNQKVSEINIFQIPLLTKKIILIGAIEILLILYLALKYIFFNAYNASDIIIWLLTIILPAIMICMYEGKKPDYSKLKLENDELFFLGCVILFLCSLLLPALNVLPYVVHYDEATIGNLARSFMKSPINIFELNEWYGYANFGFFPYYLILQFISNDLWGLRLSGLISALISVLPFYYLARFMFNKEIAAIASIIMYSGHCFFFFFRTGMHHSDGLVLYVITISLLYLGLKVNSKLFLYLSGVFCAFGFFSYMSARILVIIIILYLITLLIYIKPKQIILKHLIIYITGFIICFMPLGISFLKNPTKANQRSGQINILIGENAYRHASGKYQTDSKTLTFLNTIANHLWISTTSFNANGDKDRQYRLHRPFLDFISSMLFLLGFPIITFFTIGFFIPFYIHLKMIFKKETSFTLTILKTTQDNLIQNEKYLLIFLSFWLIVILGWALNVDPPTYQKMPILLPVLALICAVTLYNIVSYMFKSIHFDLLNKIMKKGVICFVLIGIIFLNYEVFIHSNTVGLEREDFYLVDTIISRYTNKEFAHKEGDYYLIDFCPTLDFTLKFFKENSKINYHYLNTDDLKQKLPFEQKVNSDKFFILNLKNNSKGAGFNYLSHYYPNAKKVIIKNIQERIMFIFFYVKKEDINKAITQEALS